MAVKRKLRFLNQSQVYWAALVVLLWPLGAFAFEPKVSFAPHETAFVVPSDGGWSQSQWSEAASVSEPANASQMRALINNIWRDVVHSWRMRAVPGVPQGPAPQLNIVNKVAPGHCYGLYISAGPVYCTGNGTIFVSIEEMTRLAERFGERSDAALSFLIAHEFGHHLQLINHRFGELARLVNEAPERRREYSQRFELEADCLAGVWASHSASFAADENTRREIIASLDLIGDDAVQLAAFGTADPSTFWHGTSAQRARWFMIGQQNKTLEACNVLNANEY